MKNLSQNTIFRVGILALLALASYAASAHGIALHDFGHLSMLGIAFGGLTYDMNTLNQYKVVRPGQPEVVRQRLYDYQLYPTAGQAQLTFFQLPIGQGMTSSLGAAVGSAKTYADTNMESSGMLSKGKSFLMESIELGFEPGSVATASTFTNVSPAVFAAANAAAVLSQINDVNTIRISGWLELYILSKTYLWEAPLGAFPPKTRMEMDVAIATTSATAGEVAAVNARMAGRPYYVDPQIVLDSNTNFAVYLKWPGAVATPSGFNGRIGVTLDGVQYRLSQ